MRAALASLALPLVLSACSESSEPPNANNGGSSASGGAAGSAGAAGSGGAAGTSGSSGSGGTSGAFGSGGSSGTTQNPDGGPPDDDSDIPQDKDTGPSTSASRLKAFPLGGSKTAPNGFYEYLPPGYGASSRAPLLVFWHGIGQNGNGGSELDKVLGEGPPKLIDANQWPDSRPFVVLMPQYVGVNGEIAPGKGCPSSAIIHAFLTWALDEYSIDPKQVFLTGLSCGAIGSWDYLGDHPGTTVAAAVLICGNPGDPTETGSAWERAGCEIGNAAIWSLHGDADSVVPYEPDRDTMQRLIACPKPPRRAAVLSTLEGADHGIWPPIYDLSSGLGNVYQWLLEHPKR